MNTFTRRTVMLVAAAFFLVVARAGSTDAAPPVANYAIHTLYIFNFTKYIEWPSGSNQLKIGVYDNASAAEELQKMAKAKSTEASEIIIVNTRSENELGTCQIIFIPENNSAKAAALIQRFADQPILIVTEEAEMTEKGASISFKVTDGKLRFQVSEKNIKARGLQVSRTLVALSEK